MEYKRLANVENVETTSEDTVLIVQNGEVRQTAKTNVGGSGTEYDLIVKVLVNDLGNENFEFTSEIMSGSYATVKEKIDNYKEPNALIIVDMSVLDVDWGICKSVGKPSKLTIWYENDEEFMKIETLCPINLNMHPDGTIEVDGSYWD